MLIRIFQNIKVVRTAKDLVQQVPVQRHLAKNVANLVGHPIGSFMRKNRAGQSGHPAKAEDRQSHTALRHPPHFSNSCKPDHDIPSGSQPAAVRVPYPWR
jgi:hypothetical protein